MRSVVLASAFGLLASVAVAQDWGNLASISATMGVSASRVCIGEGSRQDIGCPSYAPSVTAAGGLIVSGTVSASAFVGDGSGLTNLSASGDRIVSGTLSMLAISDTSYISLSTAGTNWGYFSSGLSYLPTLHAALVSSTYISTTRIGYASQTITALAGGGGDYIVSATASVSTSSANGGTIKMATASGLVMTVSGGNVGIGNPTPAYKLDVTGVVHGTGTAVFDNGINLTTSTDNYLYFNSDLHLARNGVGDRLRIDSSGNVGIGTTGPTAKLHVSAADNTFAALFSGASKGVRFEPTASHFEITGVDNTGSVSYQPLDVGGSYVTFSNSNVEAMRVTGGNVGIGTTGPNSQLHLSGTGDRDFRIDASNHNRRVVLGTNNGGTQAYLELTNDSTTSTKRWLLYPTASTDYFAIGRPGESAKLVLDGSGNLGIGTTGPGAPLDVNGTVKATALLVNGAAATAALHATAGTGSTTIQGTNTGTGYGIYCNASSCGGASAWQNTSDVRLKKRIEPLGNEEGLGSVLRLRPVAFHWKDENRDAIEGRKLGLIAQEVETIIPEVVHTADDPAKTKSIAYGDLVPVLVRAIQDLKADNDNLQRQINELKATRQ